MEGTTDNRETIGTTLTGDEIEPEDDSHTNSTPDWEESDGSIYPIETEFRVIADFENSGRHPFTTKIAINIPFGVDSIPSSRTESVRNDLRNRIDWENPEIGTLGTITFTEKDHVIRFYPEDERDTKMVGEWVMEQFHYILEQTSSAHFSDTEMTISDLVELQELVQENLPGQFITVGGTCRECGNKIQEETYTKADRDKGFALCDCGVGTSYPKLKPENKDK